MYIYNYQRLPFSKFNQEGSRLPLLKSLKLLTEEFFSNLDKSTKIDYFLNCTSYQLNTYDDPAHRIANALGISKKAEVFNICHDEMSLFKALRLIKKLDNDGNYLILCWDKNQFTPNIQPNEGLSELSGDQQETIKNGIALKQYSKNYNESIFEIYDKACEENKIPQDALDGYAMVSRLKYYFGLKRGLHKNEITPYASTDEEEIKRAYFIDGGNIFNPSPENYQSSEKIGGSNYSTSLNMPSPSDGLVLFLVSKNKLKKIKPIAKISTPRISWTDDLSYIDNGSNLIRSVLSHYKVKKEELDFFEIHENHPVTPMALVNKLKIDKLKVNLKGGSIPIGDGFVTNAARLLCSACSIIETRSSEKLKGLINLTSPKGVAGTILISSAGISNKKMSTKKIKKASEKTTEMETAEIQLEEMSN